MDLGLVILTWGSYANGLLGKTHIDRIFYTDALHKPNSEPK